MTLALCLLSFAAGAACHWAATRVQVRQTESDVLEFHAWHDLDWWERDL